MANPYQETSSQSQGSTESGHLYRDGDRDPEPPPPDPIVPPGALVTPPPRGDDDEL